MSLGDNIASFLRNAATKVEELQVQSALGKAELSDKFEELKKEARKKYMELKQELKTGAKDSKEGLQAKLDHLEVQLALGKAETKDELERQKKNLQKTIKELKDLWNE
jgi:hypothetical protein